MPNIEARKTVFVYANNPGESFSYPISVEFTPDEVIVRGIGAYDVGGVYTDMFLVRTNLVREGILGFACEPLHMGQFGQGTFSLQCPIQGSYNFQIIDPAGALVDYEGNLVIQLEFVKYKQYKK